MREGLDLLLPIASFACGSIPFSLLVGLAKGVDIRKVGSGNVGATNLGRALGRRYFFLGFALDMLKGLVPVLVAGSVLNALGDPAPALRTQLVWLGCALASVLGHVFSPWLKLRGGKGVATAFGAMLGVFPTMTFVGVGALLAFLAALAVWRTISISSLVAGASLPISLALWGLGLRNLHGGPESFLRYVPVLMVCVLLLVLVIYTHWTNIQRLRAGTEPKIGQRVPKPEA
jgi:glycerol-3-phosphate acyltransferase PlsY